MGNFNRSALARRAKKTALRGELLERRDLLAGLLVKLPAQFQAAAVAKVDADSYLVAGQMQEQPAVIRLERSEGGAQVNLEILMGLAGGDGRGAIGGMTKDGRLLVGASQSARSGSTLFGEATFWNAAGQPVAVDATTIPGVDDMLYAVSENGIAVGERLGTPIVATAEGVRPLPGGVGKANAVSDDGRIIAGTVGDANVFWTADAMGAGYVLRSLELPHNAALRSEPADVASDGSWIGGAVFAHEKLDLAPAIWDATGRLLHVFTSPVDNRGIVVGSGVALINGITDLTDFTPVARLFLHGAEGPVELRSWLVGQGVEVTEFDALGVAQDVLHLAAERQLLVLGNGLSGGESHAFLAVVDDFAIPHPTTGAISDWVWRDADGDGRQDADELGLEGVTVELIAAGEVVATQVTGERGGYEFRNVPPGEYRLRVHPPADMRFSPRNLGGDDHADSDVSPFTLETDLFGISAGEIVRHLDAGLTSLPPGAPWQNPIEAADVDGDGEVTTNDLLAVVVEFRDNDVGLLPAPSASRQPAPYVDVDGDNVRSFNDVLEVATVLRNAILASAEGEADTGLREPSSTRITDHLWMLVGQSAERDEFWTLLE